MYTRRALLTLAIHVVRNTIVFDARPELARKAPSSTNVSAGIGGKMFSMAAPRPSRRYVAAAGRLARKSMTDEMMRLPAVRRGPAQTVFSR
jgi:hypothetical protein